MVGVHLEDNGQKILKGYDSVESDSSRTGKRLRTFTKNNDKRNAVQHANVPLTAISCRANSTAELLSSLYRSVTTHYTTAGQT